jgi:hypothetical protein
MFLDPARYYFITLLQRDFDVRMGDLAAADAYRRKLAALEHHALSSTLRDRLINSVTNKKNRLSRDRETIEIGESNALLLHPSQFGLANPASPGGMHSKRATRTRRDAEELPNFAENNKRKRKADDNESPAPTRQRTDNGSSTPLWFAEKNAMHNTQVDSALYSIEKLFTEKELAMTYNQAALAAHRYMQRHQPYSDDFDTPPNGKSDSGSEHEKALNAAGDMDIDDADSPPGGVDMARQFSHATRSTRAVGALGNFITGLGIDALGDLNYPGNMEALTKQIPKMPPFLASVMQKGYVKGDAANQPAGLSPDEAAAELDIIRRGRTYNDNTGFGRNLELENGGKPLLEAVAIPKRYDYWVKSDNRGMLDSKGFLTSNLRDELGGESMSKQSSRGVSEMGGTPMSRQATGEGTSSRGRRLKPIAGMA